jgi:hypothetical protein
MMSKRAGSTVVEVKGSLAVYVSQPQAVAPFIEQAASGTFAAAGVGSANAKYADEGGLIMRRGRQTHCPTPPHFPSRA